MSLGLIGKKLGMTRIFTERGNAVPVTVIEVLLSKVSQIKNIDTDGYNAIQVAYYPRVQKHVTKPLQGHCKKAEIDPTKHFKEFLLEQNPADSFKVGDELSLEVFTVGQVVDVSGVSKGKGFAGVIKRHNFSSQDATHGNSVSHNVPGSIGQRQSPGKVFKGKKMAGRLGGKNTTTQNLTIVSIDADKRLIFVEGAIPGAKDGVVVIKPAVKEA
ncbi:MAG: 50S ribosomal protein L3 [Gammaproteobacteria bacterium]